jgi:hypothetical protein
LARPYLKRTHHKKRAGGVVQGVGLEFKPQYHQQNKTKQNKKPKPNQTKKTKNKQTNLINEF